MGGRLPEQGLDLNGFRTAYCDARAKQGMPGLDEFIAAFKLFDKDGNGTLDMEETLALFAEVSPVQVPREEIVKTFKKIDTSGDGKIDGTEFAAYLSKVWTTTFSRRHASVAHDPEKEQEMFDRIAAMAAKQNDES